MWPSSRKKQKAGEQTPEADVPPAELTAVLTGVKNDKATKEADFPDGEAGRRKESVLLMRKGATKSEAGIWRFQVHRNRRCTDIIFLLLFIAFWAGMVAVGTVAFRKGDPKKLVLGTDHNSKVCGSAENKGKNFIYYPKLEEDMSNLFSLTTVNPNKLKQEFDGICVRKCPLKGQLVSMRNKTYRLHYDTKSLFFRCLVNFRTSNVKIVQCYSWHAPHDPLLSVEGTCSQYMQTFAGNGSSPAYVQGLVRQNCSNDGSFYPLICNSYENCKKEVFEHYPHCAEYMTGTAPMTEQPPGQNVVFSQLMSAGAEVHRMVADMEKAAGTAFVFGAVLAVFMGFVWTGLVQVSAPMVVWGTVFLSMFTLSLATMFFFAKGGVLGAKASAKLIKTTAAFTMSEQELAPWVAVDEEYQKHWRAAGYVFCTITAILLCFILFFWSKIQKAIAIVREAGRAMRAMPLIALFPIISIVFFVCIFLYCVVVVGYLMSMETVKTSTTSMKDFGGHLMNKTVHIEIEHKQLKFMLCYHIIGFLWTTEVIRGVEMVTIAGAVSQFYWRPVQVTVGEGSSSRIVRCINLIREFLTSAMTRSFYRVLRYHMGSVCFGGLVLTIAHIIRIVTEYLLRKMKSAEENNCMVKVVASSLRCLTWMLKEVLQFISDQAYIVVAMQGVSFCSAVREAYTLLKGQVAQLIAVQVVAKFVLILGKAFIVVTCTALMFVQLDSGGSAIPFAPGGIPNVPSGDQQPQIAPNATVRPITHVADASPSTDNGAIADPTMPLLLVVVLSFVVAGSFMDTFRIAIETLFLCYASDSAMNDPPIFDLHSRALAAEAQAEVKALEEQAPVKLVATGKALEGVKGPPVAKGQAAVAKRSRPVRKKKAKPVVNPAFEAEFDS